MESHSLEFYREHAQRYARVSEEFLCSGYLGCSHPAFKTDLDLLNRLMELAPGRRGLDAGCGAGARDVYFLSKRGYDMFGVDAVAKNIQVAKELHPVIAGHLQVADLREPLPFPDADFDLVLCNAVIQHIPSKVAKEVTLPELVRVLRPGGVLQLMFKNGNGVETVIDRAYGEAGVSRTFELYNEYELLGLLEGCGCKLVEAASEDALGGLIFFTDPKPMQHCVFWVTKG